MKRLLLLVLLVSGCEDVATTRYFSPEKDKMLDFICTESVSTTEWRAENPERARKSYLDCKAGFMSGLAYMNGVSVESMKARLK